MSWIHNDYDKGSDAYLGRFSTIFQEEPARSSDRGMGPCAHLRRPCLVAARLQINSFHRFSSHPRVMKIVLEVHI